MQSLPSGVIHSIAAPMERIEGADWTAVRDPDGKSGTLMDPGIGDSGPTAGAAAIRPAGCSTMSYHRTHWTKRIHSEQSWEWARENVAYGGTLGLRRLVFHFVRDHFNTSGVPGHVVRIRDYLFVWPSAPDIGEAWLVSLRIVDDRVEVYHWPAGGAALVVDAGPSALSSALVPPVRVGMPVPIAGTTPVEVLAAYRWRCAWCEWVMRERFDRAVLLSSFPWLDDIRITPGDHMLRIEIRAQPPIYRISHGLLTTSAIIDQTLFLNGPLDSDRELLLAAVQPRPVTLASLTRKRFPRPRRTY